MFLVELADEMLRQQWNVFFAVAQRRQMDRKNGKAVVEIFAQPSVLDSLTRFLIRSGNDAQ